MEVPIKDHPNLPTGTVTFLLTDVEGSMRLWERHRDSMHYAMGRHDFLVREAVQAHRGLVPKGRGEGDSQFAVFEHPSDAALAAMAIQKALKEEPWPEIGELRVRIALHTGEPELREGDYYGPTVNRCARMRAAAHGGQIVLSETARRLIGQRLPAGAWLKDLGLHRLKDLQEPERIYQLCAEGLQETFPLLESLSATRHNLPVQLTSFVGREAQIAKLKELIFKGRLITLIGAGGCGKTRLALQVGAECVEHFPDGVWFVGLVSVEDPKLVAAKIAESLPISLQNREPIEAILEEYRDARAMFLIDNCEHLIRDAAPVINRLLHECPHLVVVTTSREPLSVSGELAFYVPTMACDLKGAAATLDAVSALEAVRLFRERASGRLSGEEILTRENAADIAAICKKLDGLPLALEQAASNLLYLTPKEILHRLEQHFAMLALDEEGVDLRHRTIQATIDWSYGLLQERERELFARLSIFAGGCTLQSAEHVCAGQGLQHKDLLEAMELLVKRSLVVAEPSAWGVKRYRMLEPIREYAATKLQAGQEAQLRDRHLEWHCNLANQAYDVGLDAEDGLYLKWLAAELDNVRAAMRWADGKPQHASAYLQMCIHMNHFWISQDITREGSSEIQRALSAANNTSDELRANAINVLGAFALMQCDTAAAEKAFLSSGELWQKVGNELRYAATVKNLGDVYAQRHDLAAATRHYTQALAVLERGGNVRYLGQCLAALAGSLQQLGDSAGSIQAYERAIEQFRVGDNRFFIAHALQNLLGVRWGRGELLSHRAECAELLELAEELQGPAILQNALLIASCFALDSGDAKSSARLLGASDALKDKGAPLQPAEIEYRKHLETKISAGLDDAAMRRAKREGRAMSTAEALQQAKALVADPEDL